MAHALSRVLGSIGGQFMRTSCWTKWHWDKVFSEHFQVFRGGSIPPVPRTYFIRLPHTQCIQHNVSKGHH